MPRKPKQDEKFVQQEKFVKDLMDGKLRQDASADIYQLSLRIASQIVSTLESRILSAGFNISNWRAQLAGNQGLNFACEIKALIAGEKIKTTLPVAYILAGNKGASGAMWESYEYSKGIDDYAVESLRCIGFLFAQMMNGKPFAVVNQGRGLIIERLIETLNPDDLYVTIKGIPVDDKGNLVDYEYNLDDVKNFAHGFAHRSRVITSLDTSKGRETKPLSNKKPTARETW